MPSATQCPAGSGSGRACPRRRARGRQARAAAPRRRRGRAGRPAPPGEQAGPASRPGRPVPARRPRAASRRRGRRSPAESSRHDGINGVGGVGGIGHGGGDPAQRDRPVRRHEPGPAAVHGRVAMATRSSGWRGLGSSGATRSSSVVPVHGPGDDVEQGRPGRRSSTSAPAS